MIAEIISTGTELLLGQIVNTNAQYLAQELNALGINVYHQSVVGDNHCRMERALESALQRSELVITTGGLGPTLGDITKEVTAKLLDRPLYLHEPSAAAIKAHFAARGLIMTENNLRQAMIPQDAAVIDNERGTAPGVIVEAADKTIIHLPGPPQEVQWMFKYKVVPYLTKRYELKTRIVSRVLKTYGITESALEEKIKDLVLKQSNPTIALLARSGEIHLRLTANGETLEAAQQLINNLESILRQRINDNIFAVDTETLETVLGRMLTAHKMTLATAESCTGGMISSRLTSVPGSSEYFLGALVAYSNEVKAAVLGVSSNTLAEYGAVSEQTAIAMAEQARQLFATDLAISVTGIAGPAGATVDKPTGLVYIAVAGKNGTVCSANHYVGQREGVRQRAVSTALYEAIRYIEKY